MGNAILITGAASGVGEATARWFADKGWFVGLADINSARLEPLSVEIGHKRSMAIPLDVTSRNDWTAGIEAFSAATGGRMDVLFNNAGLARGGVFERVPQDDMDEMLAVNVRGVINGILAALPVLKDTAKNFGRARIINSGSAAAIAGSPGISVYAATKYAVRGLTESLAPEFARFGVEICEIQPWFVDTPMLDTPLSGSNLTYRERVASLKMTLMPPSAVAAAVWRLATASRPEVHMPVGRRAHWTRFVNLIAPGYQRRRATRGFTRIRRSQETSDPGRDR